jgi:hypothetical protein
VFQIILNSDKVGKIKALINKKWERAPGVTSSVKLVALPFIWLFYGKIWNM